MSRPKDVYRRRRRLMRRGPRALLVRWQGARRALVISGTVRVEDNIPARPAVIRKLRRVGRPAFVTVFRRNRKGALFFEGGKGRRHIATRLEYVRVTRSEGA